MEEINTKMEMKEYCLWMVMRKNGMVEVPFYRNTKCVRVFSSESHFNYTNKMLWILINSCLPAKLF